MTYSELKSIIASYLHRDDLTTQIVSFITVAQARVNRDLMIADMEKRATATVESAFVDLPTDYSALRSVQYSGSTRKVLMHYTKEQLDVQFPTDEAGIPVAFTIHGMQMEIRPVPEADSTIEIVYFKRYAAFSDDDDTNWVLTYNPQIYIYAAMIEAQIYLMGDERLQLFAEAYKNEVAALNEEYERTKMIGSPRQIRQLISETP